MSHTTFGTIVVSAMLLAGCSNPVKPAHEEYSGSGGMTQWNIDPIVYLYHYQHGFTGSDALGYDEQLQTVWSRLGAAVTCNIRYNKQDMIQRLMHRFGEKAITHELNGIGFHSVQSRKVPDFCNPSRIKNITSALQRYSRGQFD
ncbi:hypothetical protein SAMN03080615_03487 [Amphritea atlantica]|uniref:Uncharacterized protein n=1 Tax=Amphritea atlantica TaxID=355243 RepID=A0A1H9KH80_9GAMM|nr:hypothetical protein [Amphritea atlantica]SEQ98287.1 hypothetical protein SAMN03080615_03487 [Amphritea atlantica]